MDKIFKAVAHGSRRKLLDLLLARDGQTLGELCAGLPGVSRQAVSKHLEILEGAGLVKVEWRGWEKLHFLELAPIGDGCWQWANKYRSAWLERAKAKGYR